MRRIRGRGKPDPTDEPPTAGIGAAPTPEPVFGSGRATQRASRGRLVLCVLAGALAMWGGCARVRPHVALPTLNLADPSFLMTGEGHVSSPLVSGNAVDILLNGEQIFPAMLEAVRSARRTITYGQYFYDEGPVSEQLAEALAERCRAGVEVRVLLDAF